MLAPINFKQWIDENRHLLKPPIGNKVIWKDGAFICMVVGGPNQRTDYHYDEGPEFFYQIEGDMVLKIMDAGVAKDILIKQGEIFLLPPRVPHSPQRFENTVGLVIERQRLEGELDGLIWYCEECGTELYSEYFTLTDVETQFPPIIEKFYSSTEHRSCRKCHYLNPAPV